MPLLMCSELGKNPDGRKTKRQSELTDLEILSVELRSNNPTLWKKRAELRDAWNNYETQKGLYAGCLAAPVFVAGSFLRQAAFGTPVAVVHTAVSLAALVGGVGVFASTVLLDVGLKEAHLARVWLLDNATEYIPKQFITRLQYAERQWLLLRTLEAQMRFAQMQ
eukprot:TRINITY_DN2135_c0_g1_i8.p1 TRINITY_DN2135_c0_g1~~TRINITY_DN2135_c0_g1_i8.p1  ORF type:complete len:165 (-),score=33.70 TRINITY_DN2135_c0_g1_i8:33-527(-)